MFQATLKLPGDVEGGQEPASEENAKINHVKLAIAGVLIVLVVITLGVLFWPKAEEKKEAPIHLPTLTQPPPPGPIVVPAPLPPIATVMGKIRALPMAAKVGIAVALLALLVVSFVLLFMWRSKSPSGGLKLSEEEEQLRLEQEREAKLAAELAEQRSFQFKAVIGVVVLLAVCAIGFVIYKLANRDPFAPGKHNAKFWAVPPGTSDRNAVRILIPRFYNSVKKYLRKPITPGALAFTYTAQEGTSAIIYTVDQQSNDLTIFERMAVVDDDLPNKRPLFLYFTSEAAHAPLSAPIMGGQYYVCDQAMIDAEGEDGVTTFKNELIRQMQLFQNNNLQTLNPNAPPAA